MNNHDTIKNNEISLSMVHYVSASDLGLATVERKDVSKKSFAVVIRSLLQNWRQGTVGCKTRSQVSGSNKKPWRQKGTGRARSGAVTSPLWRGGGIIFGPQARVRMMKVSKQLKRSVTCGLIWHFIDNKSIYALDCNINGEKPSTKNAMFILKQANLLHKNINLLLPASDIITALSFSNIPSVRIVLFDAANVYTLADSHCWVVLKRDIDMLKEMVTQWF